MGKITSVVIVFVIILSIYILAQKEEPQGKSEISVSEVQKKIENDENIFLLDVRTEAEFDGNLGHIEGANLMTLSTLQNRLDELEEHKDKEIIVICRSGNRSGIATNILKEEGLNAVNMVGGMIAYRAMEKSAKKIESQKNKIDSTTIKDQKQ